LKERISRVKARLPLIEDMRKDWEEKKVGGIESFLKRHGG
jgi:hypothetical protein